MSQVIIVIEHNGDKYKVRVRSSFAPVEHKQVSVNDTVESAFDYAYTFSEGLEYGGIDTVIVQCEDLPRNKFELPVYFIEDRNKAFDSVWGKLHGH